MVTEKSELKVMPDLNLVVARRVERFIKLGFPTEVYPYLSPEMAEDKYRVDFTLPEGADQPEAYAGRFDFLLIVEPRITLTRKHELAARIKELDLDRIVRSWTTSQVREYIDTAKLQDLTGHPTELPYLVFTHDGQRHLGHSVKDALKRFDSDEVGKPQLEVTDHYLQLPAHFRYRGQDAGGSRLEDGGIPFLGLCDGGPRVDASLVDVPIQHWGVSSRGKEVIELGV